MIKIGIKKLTPEAFAPYGEYANLLDPKGSKIGNSPVTFYRDMTQQYLGTTNTVSYSVCVVEKRELIIGCMEYHNFTCEAMMCIDGDCILYFAPACPGNVIPVNEVEAFLIPQGTMIVARPGVWHMAGFPYNKEKAHILIALPERAYANDCVVVDLPEEKRIQIVL